MANRLINEQSLYLLQHAHNPVDWYPWGEEAFDRAKKEYKPVIVSIGYAACHWCHVMERESFENEEVASFMNEHFVCIKVDREERPDVDHLYMDAVQAISGSGGWPLNAFVTSDKVPFYGGTYFPPKPMYNRSSWMQVLQRIHEIWTTQPEELAAQTEQMVQYLKQISTPAVSGLSGQLTMDICREIAETVLRQADTEQGGFGRAPKFPNAMSISYLLQHYHYTKYQPALNQALLSLDKMIDGGIYDQIGGGFCRYSTDDIWLAPHFEKMLYDNALLIIALCDAYSIERRPRYKAVIEEVIAFAERELKSPEGGYYSALDADSEGVEGKFYTWSFNEFNNAIPDKYKDLIAAHFGVQEAGNWEHTNILHVAKAIDDIAHETSVFKDEITEAINAAKEALFKTRKTRERPATDDKSLLSWNALMNKAITKAAVVLGDDNYLEMAAMHMQWMLKSFVVEDELKHVWKQNKARIAAHIDDYTYLISALLDLGSAVENESMVAEANKWAKIAVKEFRDQQGNFFYYTAESHNDVPVRKIDVYDGALPSANAVMAQNLFILGACFENFEMIEQASYMLHSMAPNALRYSTSFGYWNQVIQQFAVGFRYVVCSGPGASNAHKQLLRYFLPHIYTLTSKKEISDLPLLQMKFLTKENLIFVCTEHSCLPPLPNIETALPVISQLK